MIFRLSFIFTVATANLSAQQVVEYSGTARSGNEHFYTETHRLTFNKKKKLLEALTIYSRPNGEPIAELRSDFRESLTAPIHTLKDLRTGKAHGVRREEGDFVMYLKEGDGEEQVKRVASNQPGENLLVGCQGLNYFIIENLDQFSQDKTLPLTFLIPGSLDTFDFKMQRVQDVDESTAEFEIYAENWFMRLFAPKLIVRYDKIRKRIVWYKGISVIADDSGKTPTITIEYHYPKG